MNRRAFAIALVVGILGIFLLFLYQRRFEVEASGGERIRVLTVIKQVDRGKPLTDDNIATREIPIAYIEERSVKEAEKSKILNLRVGTTVKAGQTLMWTDLAIATDDRRVIGRAGQERVAGRVARVAHRAQSRASVHSARWWRNMIDRRGPCACATTRRGRSDVTQPSCRERLRRPASRRSCRRQRTASLHRPRCAVAGRHARMR